MTGKIPLTMDDRECRGPIPGILERHGGFDISIERLTAGDFRVDQRFLFERKTLSDLVKSIISGHLFRQALRLTEATVADLASIAGIGPRTTHRIVWAVKEETARYERGATENQMQP